MSQSSLFTVGAPSNSASSGAGGPTASQYQYRFKLEFVPSGTSPSVGCATAGVSSAAAAHARHLSPQKPTNQVDATVDPLGDNATPPSLGGGGSCGCPVPHQVWLACRTAEEKADWIACLLTIQTYRCVPSMNSPA